jgi:hypothetical protein
MKERTPIMETGCGPLIYLFVILGGWALLGWVMTQFS